MAKYLFLWNLCVKCYHLWYILFLFVWLKKYECFCLSVCVSLSLSVCVCLFVGVHVCAWLCVFDYAFMHSCVCVYPLVYLFVSGCVCKYFFCLIFSSVIMFILVCFGVLIITVFNFVSFFLNFLKFITLIFCEFVWINKY